MSIKPTNIDMGRLFATWRHRAATLSAAAILLTATAHVSVVDAQGLVRQVSADVADAAEPSISEDGRWVVFTGRVGERTSVFRTDLELATTTEISPGWCGRCRPMWPTPPSRRSARTVAGSSSPAVWANAPRSSGPISN